MLSRELSRCRGWGLDEGVHECLDWSKSCAEPIWQGLLRVGVPNKKKRESCVTRASGADRVGEFSNVRSCCYFVAACGNANHYHFSPPRMRNHSRETGHPYPGYWSMSKCVQQTVPITRNPRERVSAQRLFYDAPERDGVQDFPALDNRDLCQLTCFTQAS